MRKYAMWAVIAGLAIDLIDAMTDTSATGSGGALYGPGKPLEKVFQALPGVFNPGEALAAAGLIVLMVNRG